MNSHFPFITTGNHDMANMVPQFVKYLTSDDCSSNEMSVPSKFASEFEYKFFDNVKLKIRNGYKFWVRFGEAKSVIVGMSSFYNDFGLNGGEILVFEYCDIGRFNVYIIGRDGVEIQYPCVVHASQNRSPRTVKVVPGGWKFLKNVMCTEEVVDEVVPPRAFRAQFAPIMSGRVRYVLNNGQRFCGYYHRLERTLSGLGAICQALGLSNFNSFDVLIFTYDCSKTFTVSLVDGGSVETVFDGFTLVLVPQSLYLSRPGQFVVEVQPFHMLTHCHGVDLRGQFEELRALWNQRDEIRVYKEDDCWELEVRKRPNSKRTTFHGGWLKFRDDMELVIGDKCVYKWKDGSCRKFIVHVLRASEVGNVA